MSSCKMLFLSAKDIKSLLSINDILDLVENGYKEKGKKNVFCAPK